jgi:hypothetical protein
MLQTFSSLEALKTKLDSIASIDSFGSTLIGTAYKPVKFNLKKLLSGTLESDANELLIKQFIASKNPYISLSKKKYYLRVRYNNKTISEYERTSDIMFRLIKDFIKHRGLFIQDQYAKGITFE